MASNYEIEGTLYKIMNEEQISDKFKKRSFVIETTGEYAQHIALEFHQDKCSILDQYKKHDQVKVFFNIRGREWNERFFVNLNAWRIEHLTKDAPEPKEKASATVSTENDDLPF